MISVRYEMNYDILSREFLGLNYVAHLHQIKPKFCCTSLKPLCLISRVSFYFYQYEERLKLRNLLRREYSCLPSKKTISLTPLIIFLFQHSNLVFLTLVCPRSLKYLAVGVREHRYRLVVSHHVRGAR
jgi:hypothetical protein